MGYLKTTLDEMNSRPLPRDWRRSVREGTMIFEDLAVKLLNTRFRLFLPFILAFYLPGFLLYFLLQWRLTAWISPDNLAQDNVYNGFNSSQLQLANTAGASHEPSLSSPTLHFTSITMIWWIVQRAFLSLALAAFTKCVAYIYDNESEDNMSIMKQVLVSLPHTLLKLFVTQLWFILFFGLVSFVPFAILLHLNLRMATNPITTPTTLTFALYSLLDSTFWFTAYTFVAYHLFLANQITVLEPGIYGWAAIKRSSTLVKENTSLIVAFVVMQNLIGSHSVLYSYYSHLHRSNNVSASSMLEVGWDVILLNVFAMVLNLYFLLVMVVIYFLISKPKLVGDESTVPIVKAYIRNNFASNPDLKLYS